MAKKKPKAVRPQDQLNALLRNPCSTVGHYETLAGVDIVNPAERHALWQQFRHLFQAPTEVLFDAVLSHCACLALARVAAGELSLLTKERAHEDR